MGVSPKIQMSCKQPRAQSSQPSLPFANPKYSRFHGVTQKQTNKSKYLITFLQQLGAKMFLFETKESENICCQASRLEKQRVSSSCGAKPRILHANQPQTVLCLPSLHNLVQKKKERIPLMFETPTCAKTPRTFFFFQVPVCFHLTAAWSAERLLVSKGDFNLEGT